MGEGRVLTTTAVSVRGLSLMADVGINAEEIGRPQPLVLSVTLQIDDGAVETLDQTVDYRRIVQAAESLARRNIPLIETYAQRLCRECLGWRGVRQASVSIDKPSALTQGLAGVTVTSARAGNGP